MVDLKMVDLKFQVHRIKSLRLSLWQVTMTRDPFGNILLFAFLLKLDTGEVLRNPLNLVPLSLRHLQGVLQKIIFNVEGQYPTFSFDKNYQI